MIFALEAARYYFIILDSNQDIVVQEQVMMITSFVSAEDGLSWEKAALRSKNISFVNVTDLTVTELTEIVLEQ